MNSAERKAIRKYLSKDNFENMLSVTLSMKQRELGEKLDPIKASQNLRHFLNLLNKKTFGNSFKRNGRRVEVIPVLENSCAGRLHYHLAIRNPNLDRSFWFETQIKHLWSNTRWGYSENKIERYADAGWIKYITKLNSHDEVDWENFYRVRRV